MTQATATDAKVELPSIFKRENFDYSGGYLIYFPASLWDRKNEYFVARFKYNRKRKGRFLTFLIKNFTPAEYFGRLENNETPLGILMSKGFQA